MAKHRLVFRLGKHANDVRVSNFALYLENPKPAHVGNTIAGGYIYNDELAWLRAIAEKSNGRIEIAEAKDE